MPKLSSNYVCQQCGASSTKWFGKCPQCNAWGSLVETIVEKSSPLARRTARQSAATPTRLDSIAQVSINRATTGIFEFDRVLGGGIVPGMAVLIAGEPGIGKSTLLLKLAANLANKHKVAGSKYQVEETASKNTSTSENTLPVSSNNGAKNLTNTKYQISNTVLYVAGEESPNQIKIRANRLGIGGLPIALLAQTDVDVNAATIEAQKPDYVIVDSVQTLSTQDLTSSAGSVGQVRESVDRLTSLAKRTNIPIFFVGHITKEGSIAGPKVLEHIVDTVLLLEGDNAHNFRILRAMKNRFGSTDEVGVFSMEDTGIEEVSNPSQSFLAARLANTPGSVVVPTMEGTRPILVEIQALVAPTTLTLPRRVGIGIDYNRLQFLLALISNHVSSKISQLDVFVNVAGGLKVGEPALDLGIALAVTSALKGLPIDAKLACFGEVGLLGEVRTVRFAQQRSQEAKRLGYAHVLSPEDCKSLVQAIAKVFKKS